MTQLKQLWKASIFAVLSLFLVFAAPLKVEAAYADQANNPSMITNILCNAVNQLTGGIGRSIAILIIISLAIGLFLGKVSWGLGIAVAVGMGILFGAKDVVNILSGNTMCTV